MASASASAATRHLSIAKPFYRHTHKIPETKLLLRATFVGKRIEKSETEREKLNDKTGKFSQFTPPRLNRF